jgi:type VI secretion system secreted protein Hcp
MTYATYMKISGIPGDCAEPAHKDWIELLNCSNSVSAPDSHGRPAQYMDMAINKYLDRSSPLLALACTEGWRLEEILVETTTDAGTKVMEIRLSDATITNHNLSSGGDPNHPAYDSFSLKFGMMEWSYFPAGAAEPVKCAWKSEELRGPAAAPRRGAAR